MNPVLLSVLEWLVALIGAWSIWLTVKEQVAAWPVGIIGCLLAMIWYYSTGWIANAGLQVYFMVIAVYGWYAWTPSAKHQAATIKHTPPALLVIGVIISVFIAWLWYCILANHTFTDWQFEHQPLQPDMLRDTITTTLSIVAQLGTVRKYVESWLLWITADIIYTEAFFRNAYWAMSIYSALLTILAIMGGYRWYKILYANR